MNRRYFFFGALSTLAVSCNKAARETSATVSIIKAASYSVELASVIKNILLEHRIEVAGKNVVLKPNLVEFSPDAPINTNPAFVAAAAEAFHSLGALRVRIAEGPGHRRMTLDMAEAAGFFSAIPRFESRFTDLNLDEVTKTAFKHPFSTLSSLYLPHTALAADLLVSLPKMKTHHWAGATLSMKNLFGVVPGGVYGWPKNVLHWAGIDESVADLQPIFPNQFCLVDGIDAMEGNGPILGSRKHMGLIVAGAHPPSVDAACCQIMKIDPKKVRYLTLAASTTRLNIYHPKQIGEDIQSVSAKFALHPALENKYRLS
jgi:uncharacterized protein (DUF362 family)